MKESEWKDKLSEGHIDFIKRTYAEMIAYQIIKNKMKEKNLKHYNEETNQEAN